MKHFILLSFIHLFLTSTVFSQEIAFSEIYKNESGKYPLLGLAENADEKKYLLATFHDKSDSYTVNFYLSDSMLVSQNNATHSWKKEANDKIAFLGMSIINKKFYSLFSVISESNMTNSLVMIEYDNGKTTVTTLDRFEMKSLSNTGNYQVSFSPGKKNMVVLKELLIEKGKNESVQLIVYDEGFNKITDVGISFSTPSKPNPVNKVYVTDKGDIYMIKKDREKTEYKFYIYAYNGELKGWNHRQFLIPTKMIADIDAVLNASQEFVVAGFWNAFDVTSYQGYFYYRFDASLKPVSKVANKFTADFFSNFIPKKNASREDAMINDYWFENLITAPDNTVYILAEKESYENINGKEKYFYGDIMYIKLSPEGKFIFGGALKNKQESENDEGEWSSFNYAVCKDTLHLFHNELDPSEIKNKFEDASFAGIYHSKILEENKTNTAASAEMKPKDENQMAFHPQYVYQTSDNYLLYLLLAKDKKSYALGKMKLR